jgi:hypothetical protein
MSSGSFLDELGDEISQGVSAVEQAAGELWNDLGDMQLPDWLVEALGYLGITWPTITRTGVLQFADLVRQFGSAVESTHDEATQAINALVSAFQRAGTSQAIESGWLNLKTLIDDVVACCQTLAAMLEAASQIVPAIKAAALASLTEDLLALGGAAASFVMTGGLSAEAAEAVLPIVQNAVNALEQRLIMEALTPVINRALDPLIDGIVSLAEGLDWAKAAGTAGAQVGVQIDPVAAENALAQLEALAGTLQERMAPVTAGMQALPFAGESPDFGASADSWQ